jgi:hypothetical protein
MIAADHGGMASGSVKSVSIVRRSRADACGVTQFSRHLAAQPRQHGWAAAEQNLSTEAYRTAAATIVHYVPSMWAGAANSLERLLGAASSGRVIVVMHGIYGPDTLAHRRETPCPDLPAHLLAVAKFADSVVALSQSCEDAYAAWFSHGFSPRRIKTLPHPGIYGATFAANPDASYVFCGGISRPKKDIAGRRIRQLLASYSRSGTRVWLHVSNTASATVGLPTWQVSSGLMTDREWAAALYGSSVVLCPYETGIQCVSGIIFEALSVGTPVLTTDFLFAREAQRRHPQQVVVEDDLRNWPRQTRQLMRTGRAQPDLSSWDRFSLGILTELW